jgi:CheY-like chemotaxis protein
MLVSGQLEDAGCEVYEAANGIDALQQISRLGAVDLLVTDIRMPELDGWSLAERARDLQPSMPVIYVTGYSDVDPRPVAGATILDKPYASGQLVSAATALLSA